MAATHSNKVETGQVIGTFRRHFLVQTPTEPEPVLAITQGRKLAVLCGDRVTINQEKGSWIISAIQERSNYFYRADAWKEKAIAANLDQIIALIAPEPALDEELLTRWIVAAEAQHCPIVLVLNKADLPQTKELEAKLTFWKTLGYPLITISALFSSEALLPHLKGKTSLLIGQSGVGKSSLINALVPDANSRTQAISEDNLGRHTTTYSQLYRLPKLDAAIIDSPGMQAFGLQHLSQETITEAFRDFHPYLQKCRFRNCLHENEPDCALIQAVQTGAVLESRYLTWRKLKKKYQ